MLSNSLHKDLQDALAEKLERVSYHGDYFTCLCVFHEERRASLFVYKKDFRCASCGATGSIERLYKKVTGSTTRISPSSSRNFVAYRKWFREYGSIAGISKAAHQFLLSTPAFEFYFKERGISQFIKQGMFGWIDNWLFFPVKSCDGQVREITIRASKTNKSEAKYFLIPHEGEHQHLYIPNHERVKLADEIYVPFGIIDAWSLEACGLASMTGMAGQNYSPEWFDEYRKTIWIIPDKGEEAKAQELKYRLGWRGKILLLDWPAGCKDCDDIRMKQSVKSLLKLIEEAK